MGNQLLPFHIVMMFNNNPIPSAMTIQSLLPVTTMVCRRARMLLTRSRTRTTISRQTPLHRKWDLFCRRIDSGKPFNLLGNNYCQHNTCGKFFSKSFYDSEIQFHNATKGFGQDIGKATRRWLQSLVSSSEFTLKSNSFMVAVNAEEQHLAQPVKAIMRCGPW